MFKRFSACFLALVLLLGLLPGVRAEGAVIASGTAGDDISWVLDDSYCLTLTGTGEMYDYKSGTRPWQAYVEQILSVEIGEGITSVGNYAFFSCDNLLSVSLPSTLVRAGIDSFSYCKVLSSVEFPDGMQELGVAIFFRCENLTRVVLPDSVTTIGRAAFEECPRLRDIQLPANLTTLEQGVLSDCVSLETLIIPEGVTSIGNYALSGCTSLTTLSIPKTVTSVDKSFYGCSSLERFDLDPANPAFCIDDQGALYTIGMDTLVSIPGGYPGDFVIPDTVTTVREYAGYGCVAMTGLVIPDRVTDMGDYAFRDCGSLAQVSISESVSTLPRGCFYKCGSLTHVTVPDSVTVIEDSVFSWCESLTRVDMPARLEVLGDAFFNCSALTDIAVPEGVTELKSRTFGNCFALETVTLPSTLVSIGQHCFTDCEKLRQINLPEGLTTIGIGAFIRCASLSELILPSTLTLLSRVAFYDSGLTTVTFTGSAPTFEDSTVFERVTATVYYPANDPTWTEEVRQNYRGWLTWIAKEMHTHTWREAGCTEPKTCTGCGVTLGEALGHDWKDLSCTRCGEARENPFTDIAPGSYYFDAVLWAVEKGITAGTDPGLFSPGASCNRAQVVTFLWRAAGSPEPRRSENPFADVGAGSYYEKAVLWAVEKGITAGTDACHFAPDQLCTRAQVVTFLWSAAGKPDAAGENPFTDVPAGAWFERAVLWAKESGITAGVSPNQFGAEAICTRAQVVTFLCAANGK